MANSSDRIPAGQAAGLDAWFIPEVKEGQVVAVEKLQNRGPRGELINVPKDEIIYSTLTAGQLEEISEQAYEDVRQQAYQEGVEQGRKDGYQAGISAGQQGIQQQLQQLQGTIHSLYNVLEGQDDEMEQALVNLATCVARSILRRELSLDASHMQTIVQQAVATLPSKDARLTVHLNPQDHRLLAQSAEIPAEWTLQADVAVSAGGCRVTTAHSVVDFTLEEQFQQTINALVEQRFTELAQQARRREEQTAELSPS